MRARATESTLNVCRPRLAHERPVRAEHVPEREHARRVPDDARAVLPPAAAPDQAQLPQAARRVCAQGAAQAAGASLHPSLRPVLFCAGSPADCARAQAAASTLAELEPGTAFQPVLADPVSNAPTAERVVLVAGKLYYDLAKARAARGLDARVALVRLEELCPFPFAALAAALRAHGAAREVVWAQEEPRNQGAYAHVAARIGAVMEACGRGAGERVRYVGRREEAVPAPGVGALYKAQQEAVIEGVFEGL